MSLKTFIIYARDDKEHKNLLLRHMRPLIASQLLQVWHDGDMLPGEEWELAIKRNLKSSDLVLVLVSVNCLNSEFIQTSELTTALERFREGLSKIIPIIISPCGWKYHPIFRGLQGLPEDMKPVDLWPHKDEAWTNVVIRLAEMAQAIQLAGEGLDIKKQPEPYKQVNQIPEVEKTNQTKSHHIEEPPIFHFKSVLLSTLKTKKLLERDNFGPDVIERQLGGIEIELISIINSIINKQIIDNPVIERGLGGILTELQAMSKKLK